MSPSAQVLTRGTSVVSGCSCAIKRAQSPKQNMHRNARAPKECCAISCEAEHWRPVPFQPFGTHDSPRIGRAYGKSIPERTCPNKLERRQESYVHLRRFSVTSL